MIQSRRNDPQNGVRGPRYPERVSGRKRIEQRPHTAPAERCLRCQGRRARDADLSDPLCSPCRASAPTCPVCKGRGTLGRDAKFECYRCTGTGLRPIPKIKRRMDV